MCPVAIARGSHAVTLRAGNRGSGYRTGVGTQCGLNQACLKSPTYLRTAFIGFPFSVVLLRVIAGHVWVERSVHPMPSAWQSGQSVDNVMTTLIVVSSVTRTAWNVERLLAVRLHPRLQLFRQSCMKHRCRSFP